MADSRCGARAGAGGCAWRLPKLPKAGWRWVPTLRETLLLREEKPLRNEPPGRASAVLATVIATTMAAMAAKRVRLNMKFTVVR